jgi:hypothetical protein
MNWEARSIAQTAISTGKRAMVRTVELAKLTGIAVIKWVRKLPTAGANFGRFLWWILLAGIISKRLRLVLALSLFILWMAYLSYAALYKSRSPIVSHAQTAAATVAVVAEVEPGEEGKPSPKVKVIDLLTPDGPPPGSLLLIENLPTARGFEGKGEYLLLLSNSLYIIPPQRSPGNPMSGYEPPTIYRWNDEVRKQYESLHR